jgi:small subunit ribosomal protein S3Ae
MAVGKNKRISKGGKRGKKKVVEPMSRKEWYDVVAPSNFRTRQISKTICNKTQGTKIASDYLIGRVYEGNLADIDQANAKDEPFRKVKFSVQEVQGRNLLTQFHGMDMTTDRLRSLVQKWGTLIESVIEAKTADGFVFRIFVIAFTRRQKGQLSKNTYAKTRLEKWVRHRMTKLTQKRLEKLNINDAVTQLTRDGLSDTLFKRCNPIVPLRDVKIRKVKVIRTPKLDTQKLHDQHGEVPSSIEGEARIVEVAAEPVAAAAPAAAAKEATA